MKQFWRLVYRISPWHRGYSEGWNDGVRMAVIELRDLLREATDVVPNRDLRVLHDRLHSEVGG
ncbi:hypothetical protein ACXJJ3_06570 [Kribbella sp. WER1]